MNFRRALSSIFVAGLCACASSEPIRTDRYVEPPVSRSGLLYIYRSKSLPAKDGVTLAIDRKPVASLPDNRFTWVAVDPGQHVLSIDIAWPNSDLFLKSKERLLELEVLPGQRYLVQYRVSVGAPYAQPIGSNPGYWAFSPGRATAELVLEPAERLQEIVESLSYISAASTLPQPTNP